MSSPIFAPYRDLARQLAARLVAGRERDPLAPWREEVIVPSRGAAEQISLELIRLLPQGVAGVRLRTIDDLARALVTGVRVASEAERRLAMRLAIRSVDHPMMESRGVASMLERAYRDVRDSGLSLADFARRVKNAHGLRNAGRTQAILDAWTAYEKRIADLGVIDPSELLSRAARAISSKTPPQLVAGFYDMTGAQWQIVDALRKADRLGGVCIPTTEPFAQPFIARFEASPVALPPSESRATVLQYDSPFHELREACRRISEQLAAGIDPKEIGIVARSFDPYDIRLLHRFAGEFGFRTTLEDEIRLGSHHMGRAATTLLRLRERDFPRGDVLELVRDGLNVQTKIHVDAVDAATRRARIAGGTTDELKPMRGRSPVLDSYIALVGELETLTREVLTDFAGLFTLETEQDQQAAEKLDQIASLFKRFGGTAIGADVIDAIDHETLARPVKKESRQPVIWAGDIMRFRGRAFPHLHVVRMQDDVFPQRRTEDPLLPDSDRRLLALREIGDGREEEQLLFSFVRDAETLSFAAGDGFGKVLRPSRYLRGLPVTNIAHVPETGQRPAASRQLQLLVQAGTRSPFDGYVSGFTSPLESLSPTQLEDFGECPQKFLLKHILRVEDIEDPERALQIHHRDKGTIDHQILERFYRHTTEEQLHAAAAALPRLPEEMIERLEALVDAGFDEHEQQYPPFNRTVRDIERRATKRILREFVSADIADLAAQELMPRWFEYRFGRKHKEANHPEPFVVDTGVMQVRVEGTVDRIDVGPERFRIVDYKSGKAGRHANLSDKIDRGVRLQLALYAMAVTEFFAADPASVSGTIKPLVAGDVKAEKFAFALHEKRETLLETLRIFMRAIAGGAFPAFPNENDLEFNSCKYCPVNHSCRTKHDADERYALQQKSDPRTLLNEEWRRDAACSAGEDAGAPLKGAAAAAGLRNAAVPAAEHAASRRPENDR
ncbi:MAG TPA: PD-(D/E)XK nuclease family protein [Thermoanaerobaculia bacterium]|nr:PD-(D/E)XK nuclease family protein [Thermoanaerobaculia bacterium]